MGAAKSVNLFPDSKLALFRIKRDFLGSYHVVSYKDYNVSVLFFEKKDFRCTVGYLFETIVPPLLHS